MRDMRLSYAGFSILLLALLSGAPSAQDGQTPADSSRTGGSAVARRLGTLERRTVIDGAKNPELIPDDMAIRAALRMWTLPPNPDAAAERKFRAVTSRFRLSAADHNVLRQELQRAHMQLVGLGELSRSPDAVARRAAKLQANTASMAVWERLIEFMSADGRQKMRTALNNLKRGAKIQAVEPR